jgi:hypothetical protein
VIDHSQGRRERNISIQPASTTCGSPREKEADLVAFLTAVCTPERGGAFATSWLPLQASHRLYTGSTQGKDVARQSYVLPRPEECAISQGRSSQDPACPGRPELGVRCRNAANAALSSAALKDKSTFFQSPQSCEIRRMRESGFTHHQASSGNAPVSGCRRRTGTYMLR